MRTEQYVTRGGITVHRTVEDLPGDEAAIEPVIDGASTRHRGVLLASATSTPAHTPAGTWGFVDPPLELTSRGAAVRVSA